MVYICVKLEDWKEEFDADIYHPRFPKGIGKLLVDTTQPKVRLFKALSETVIWCRRQSYAREDFFRCTSLGYRMEYCKG